MQFFMSNTNINFWNFIDAMEIQENDMAQLEILDIMEINWRFWMFQSDWL